MAAEAAIAGFPTIPPLLLIILLVMMLVGLLPDPLLVCPAARHLILQPFCGWEKRCFWRVYRLFHKEEPWGCLFCSKRGRGLDICPYRRRSHLNRFVYHQ